MSAASLLKYVYLASFSQPKAERLLYRAIRRQKIRKVVELGVGTCNRAIRLIQVAQRYAGAEQVHYTGIDLFEARGGDGPKLPLKSAFQLLKPTAARVQLIPGDPKSALSRAANSLVGTELILISQTQAPESLARAWFYVPRMLAPGALVYREETVAEGVVVLRPISKADVERLAAGGSSTMSRAA